jgi:hypothetical protein
MNETTYERMQCLEAPGDCLYFFGTYGHVQVLDDKPVAFIFTKSRKLATANFSERAAVQELPFLVTSLRAMCEHLGVPQFAYQQRRLKSAEGVFSRPRHSAISLKDSVLASHVGALPPSDGVAQ